MKELVVVELMGDVEIGTRVRFVENSHKPKRPLAVVFFVVFVVIFDGLILVVLENLVLDIVDLVLVVSAGVSIVVARF